MKCNETTLQSPEAAAFRHHNVKIFNPFNINEDDSVIIEYHGDIDPDKCYFYEFSHKLFKNFNYYTDNSSNKYMPHHDISGSSYSDLHLNIRSVPVNLSSFLAYMDKFDHCFSVIGLSETLLNPSNVSSYGITGYNHVFLTRYTGWCGAVSLFVSE